MKKRDTAVILSVVLSWCLGVGLAGCGSVAGNVAHTIESDDSVLVAAAFPFTGRWSGPWVDSETGETGVLNATISKKGKLAIVLFNQTLGTAGKGSGTVSRAGAIKGSYAYPGSPKLALQGLLTTATNGHLVGQFEALYKRRHVGSGKFDLSPQ